VFQVLDGDDVIGEALLDTERAGLKLNTLTTKQLTLIAMQKNGGAAPRRKKRGTLKIKVSVSIPEAFGQVRTTTAEKIKT
jgi:hypothetical protein